MDFEAIKTAAEGYKPAMVKFLRDMIAIPSASPVRRRAWCIASSRGDEGSGL